MEELDLNKVQQKILIINYFYNLARKKLKGCMSVIYKTMTNAFTKSDRQMQKFTNTYFQHFSFGCCIIKANLEILGYFHNLL